MKASPTWKPQAGSEVYKQAHKETSLPSLLLTTDLPLNNRHPCLWQRPKNSGRQENRARYWESVKGMVDMAENGRKMLAKCSQDKEKENDKAKRPLTLTQIAPIQANGSCPT